jgi:hypothetical protein
MDVVLLLCAGQGLGWGAIGFGRVSDAHVGMQVVIMSVWRVAVLQEVRFNEEKWASEKLEGVFIRGRRLQARAADLGQTG